MVHQRLVQGRADDDRRAAADRFRRDGQGQIVRDAAGQFIEGIEAAGREDHHAARRAGPDAQIEIGFDDLSAIHVSQLAAGDHP